MPKSQKDEAKSKKTRKKAEARGKKNKKRTNCDNDAQCIDSSSTTSTDSSDDGGRSPKKKARASGSNTALPQAHVDGLASAALTAPDLRGAGTHHPADAPKPGADAGRAAPAGDKAAEKRARADAMMARLSAKLQSTTDPKTRMALQAKMLHLLPKCTPSQPEPKQSSLGTPAGAAAASAATSAAASASAVTAAATCRAPSFAFKLQKTPRAALPVSASVSGPEEESRRRLRQQRFGDTATASSLEEANKPSAILAESGGFGTSEALEKEYLRLTSLPRASDVRPPSVLALALRMVKAKWLQRPEYAAAAEQLKAIRQDLTVQHVRDALTVDVYETHGRLALEADDLAEFRRCHGVLRQLYDEGLPGNPAEFEAYGLLYTQATAAARNTLSLELSRVPEHLLDHPYVRHAMEVCAAARSGNYARFIALYDGAPRMSPYIMDRLLGQMRLWALQSTVAAYKPLAVPLSHLAEQLGLETEAEAAEFAEQYGAVVDRPTGCLDTRTSASQPLGPPRLAQ